MPPKRTDREKAQLSDSTQRVLSQSMLAARSDITVSAINALLHGGEYHADNEHLDQGTGHGDGGHYDLHLDVPHWDHADDGALRRPWEDLIQQDLAEITVAARLFARFEQRLQRMEALASVKADRLPVKSNEFFHHFLTRLETIQKQVPRVPGSPAR